MTPEQIAELEALADFTKGEIVSMSPGPDSTPERLEAFKEGWEGAMRLVGDALAPILAALKAQQPGEDVVERVARALAASDGLDFDEVCGVDANPDEGYCDSGTCIAAYWEEHDAEEARRLRMHHARAALAAMQEKPND